MMRHRLHIMKFFANLKSWGGVVDDLGVLFVYDHERPEQSYILVERIGEPAK